MLSGLSYQYSLLQLFVQCLVVLVIGIVSFQLFVQCLVVLVIGIVSFQLFVQC